MRTCSGAPGFDGWRCNEAKAIAEFYHDDAINHQVANEPVVGKEAINEMFQNEFAAAAQNSAHFSGLVVLERQRMQSCRSRSASRDEDCS